MRGGEFPEFTPLIYKAEMMKIYHQSYDKIDDMSLKDIMFFIRYHEAKEEYKKQLTEKEIEKAKRSSRR